LRYGVNSPSDGFDGLAQIIYKQSDNLKFQARYRYKQKYQNVVQTGGNETFVLPYEQHRWRFRTDGKINSALAAYVQADYNIYSETAGRSRGWSLVQNLSWLPMNEKFRIDCSIGYFHTDDYNTRISLYEKNILYAFSFPSFYGEGLRLFSVVKWKISKTLNIYFKIGNTRYFDRSTVGSDLELIDGRDKTDINCLIKYVF
jgi:hypothetical protein